MVKVYGLTRRQEEHTGAIEAKAAQIKSGPKLPIELQANINFE